MIEEGTIKISDLYLNEISTKSVLNFFGDWINQIDFLRNSFLNAQPFEHLIIDNFLEESYAEKISNLFPNLDDLWHKYENPIEVKYTYDDINFLDIELKNYFYYLSTEEVINLIKSISNINNLEYDNYLHGAGLHLHPRYGRLNLHLDYEKHIYSGKERRLNIILFMNKEWDKNWNGANELWNTDVTKCIVKTEVKFNRAILFKTNDISWHGVPDIIKCPNNIFRKTIAFYFVSELNSEKSEEQYRKKAKFIKRPQESYNENIQKLYDIRPTRRITDEDMKLLIPDWTVES